MLTCRAPQAAYTLQGFATTFYLVFAVVVYYYVGDGVASPAFSSLPPVWAKASYGIAIPNFLIAGSPVRPHGRQAHLCAPLPPVAPAPARALGLGM